MSVIEKFKDALADSMKHKVKSELSTQIEWAEVKKVSADGKSCDVQMLTDKEGVITEDISTQFTANMTMKPKVGSKCLVAHIMNDDSEGLLVWCEEVEKLNINGDTLGGLPISSKIAERIMRLETQLAALCASFDSHTHLIIAPIPLTATAPPLPLVTPLITPQLQPVTTELYISNKKVNHGEG